MQVSVRTCEGVELSSRHAGVRSLDILSGATADHDSLASDTEQALNAIRRPSILPSNVMQAVIGVKFIADHLKQQDDDDRVMHWIYVSFIIIYTDFTMYFSTFV